MTTDLGAHAPRELQLMDVEAVPEAPEPDQMYRHKVRLREAARLAWRSREIVVTLAERDIRAQYKQATLGVLWALLMPVLTLVIFTFLVTKVHAGFGAKGIPTALFMFPAIMCWSYFSSCVTTGGTSLLSNKALLAKTQFPRECFPIDNMLVAGVNTALSLVPLTVLFIVNSWMPKIQTLWCPVFIAIEIVFTAGVTFVIAGIIIQMRDLGQVLPLMVSLGQFLVPVVWPFSKIPTNLQPWYSFFVPLGPVMDNIRRTMLLGEAPTWNLIGLAALGSVLYLLVGYRIFKRLEVQFADLA
jgi:ABC-2 type transport system permease protein/lipopolysaccharide transport system permease protein